MGANRPPMSAPRLPLIPLRHPALQRNADGVALSSFLGKGWKRRCRRKCR
jgi:hypothetical protein